MRRTLSTNEELKSLIVSLRKAATEGEVKLWKRIALDLSKPSRQRRAVNLSRIDRFTKDNDVVIVPGKVLSSGDINHKIQVAAFTFSKAAKEKITQAKGNAISISELLKSNPKGKGIKIIG